MASSVTRDQSGKWEAAVNVGKMVKNACKRGSFPDYQQLAKLLKSSTSDSNVFMQIVTSIHKHMHPEKPSNTILNALRLVEYLVDNGGDSKVACFWPEVSQKVHSLQYQYYKTDFFGVGKEIRTKANKIIQAANLAEQNRFKTTIPCPKCKCAAHYNSLDGELLGECENCNFTFCTNCNKNYHGAVDCKPLPVVEQNAQLSIPTKIPDVKNMVKEIESETSLSQIPNVGTIPQILCDKCELPMLYDRAEQLGQCKSCKFVYCIECRQAYHGTSSCYQTKNALIPADRQTRNTRNTQETDLRDVEMEIKPTNVKALTNEYGLLSKSSAMFDASKDQESEQHAAISRSYESEFYGGQPFGIDRAHFTAEDISNAFVHNSANDEAATPKEAWPWELFLENQSGKANSRYRSLLPGEWVEDEILEAAMKLLVKDCDLSSEICVLESYIVKWCLKRDYNDGMLAGVIQDKQLWAKKTYLALLNTDIDGSGGHWILGIVQVPSRKIIIMDSSLVISKSYYQKLFFALLHIVYFTHFEEISKQGVTTFIKSWELIVSLDCIQQNNAADCGPLVVANVAGLLVQNRQVIGTPASVNLRNWIYEIVANTTMQEEKRINSTSHNKNVREISHSVDNATMAATAADTPTLKSPSVLFKPKGLFIQFKETKPLFG